MEMEQAGGRDLIETTFYVSQSRQAVGSSLSGTDWSCTFHRESLNTEARKRDGWGGVQAARPYLVLASSSGEVTAGHQYLHS